MKTLTVLQSWLNVFLVVFADTHLSRPFDSLPVLVEVLTIVGTIVVFISAVAITTTVLINESDPL